MQFRIVAFLVFCLFGTSIFALQNIEKDTTYSVSSSYNKSKKNFPQIKIVQPNRFETVKESYDIPYKNLNYRNLQMDAFINIANVNPAVVLIHGGGWKSGNKSHMLPMAQYIASKGFSCFTLEYRLSDEAKYPAGIYDIKEAIQHIKANATKYHVDTSKVAILGCSSGAQMATLIGTTNNNPKFEEHSTYSTSTTVHAIVNLDGILTFKHPKSNEGEMASWWLGGTFDEQSENWIQASALTHTNEHTPPVLFISSQYERFQAGRDEMIEILNNHNIYYKVENFSNSPHTFWLFHPWFHNTIHYITTFLNNTFKT